MKRFLVALALACAVARLLPIWTPVLAATAFVQAHAATNASGTSTNAYTANVTAGNLLIAQFCWNTNSVTLNSVTDSRGQTWTVIDNPKVGAAQSGAMAYFANTAGGADTVTFNLSAGAANVSVVDEASGAATTTPLDVHVMNAQGSTASGTDVATSTAVTTTQAGDYIFGGVCDAVQGGTWTAGTGYTKRTGAQAIQGSTAVEDIASQAAAGSTTVTFSTVTSGMFPITGIAAFKVAGGGGGGSARRPCGLRLLGVGCEAVR